MKILGIFSDLFSFFLIKFLGPYTSVDRPRSIFLRTVASKLNPIYWHPQTPRGSERIRREGIYILRSG